MWHVYVIIITMRKLHIFGKGQIIRTKNIKSCYCCKNKNIYRATEQHLALAMARITYNKWTETGYIIGGSGFCYKVSLPVLSGSDSSMSSLFSKLSSSPSRSPSCDQINDILFIQSCHLNIITQFILGCYSGIKVTRKNSQLLQAEVPARQWVRLEIAFVENPCIGLSNETPKP